MSRIGSIVLALILLASGVASAQGDRLVGRGLVEVDIDTCQVVPLIPSAPDTSDTLAISADGIAYYSRGEGGFGETLYRVDLESGIQQRVGDTGFGDVFGMAWSPGGELFATSGSTNQLFKVDLATGAGTSIGTVPGQLQAIAFRGDGALFGVTVFGGGAVYSINPFSASTTPLGDSGFGGVTGISFVDGVLYGRDIFVNALIAIDTSTGVGTVVKAPCGFASDDLATLAASVVPGADADLDGIRDSFDNCPDDANEDQSDVDLDGLGDICDPFPENPDHDLAQCEADLAQAFEDLQLVLDQRDEALSDLAQCQADLEGALADTDHDGVLDSVDICVGTPSGADVDQLGCSLAQFCFSTDTSTPEGVARCKLADWKNDEPVGNPFDCSVEASSGLCVPR